MWFPCTSDTRDELLIDIVPNSAGSLSEAEWRLCGKFPVPVSLFTHLYLSNTEKLLSSELLGPKCDVLRLRPSA